MMFPKTPAKFQSTLPVRGGTEEKEIIRQHREFQSTLPVRGGTFRPFPDSP